jgi:hypothetical protein
MKIPVIKWVLNRQDVVVLTGCNRLSMFNRAGFMISRPFVLCVNVDDLY